MASINTTLPYRPMSIATKLYAGVAFAGSAILGSSFGQQTNQRMRYPRWLAFCTYYGPELTSEAFTDWCKDQDIELRFIQPGKPDQNAYIERFNRTYREEVLTAYLFDSLEEVREVTAEWLGRYNEIRPHDALRSLPPARDREQLLATETPG